MKYNKKEEHLQIMSFQNMRKSSNFLLIVSFFQVDKMTGDDGALSKMSDELGPEN